MGQFQLRDGGSVLQKGKAMEDFCRQSCGGRKDRPVFLEDIYIYTHTYIYIYIYLCIYNCIYTYIYIHNSYYTPTYLQNHFLFREYDEYSSIALMGWG